MSIRLTKNILNLALALSIILASCSDDDGPVLGGGSQGYYVINEGGFGNGNTSISFYDRETGTVANNVFVTANGIPLGDQAQSMAIHEGIGYVVVQNSAKIEVIDLADNTIIATIDNDIVSPRYFVGLNGSKGYVSDWGADGVTGTVKVINLSNYTVTKTISAGSGTNQMVISGGELYAVNSGGFGRDNSIAVIDTNSDELDRTITLSDNPNSIQVDSEGNIWVAASGHTAYDYVAEEVIEAESTEGAIIKLNSEGVVQSTLSVGEIGFSASPSSLSVNSAGDQLYFRYSGAVYSMSTNATNLPTSPFINESYYGLSVDPVDDTIIGCEAPDFSSSGNIDIYSPAGSLLATHAVGIGPNGCTFK